MKSLDDLRALRKSLQEQSRLSEIQGKKRVIVSMGTCGIAAGARDVIKAILDEVNKRDLEDIIVTQTGCLGLCEKEPVLQVEIPGQHSVTYGYVDENKARRIVANHLVNGQIIGDWVIENP
ncbi:MAG: (2Fe-2S) ferredoxin domain-containing protein [Halanaerobium sp.]|nr:(2Fe-2S) ferredoxin domain-containing protein [Halanaerobium sp.]